MRNSYCRDDIIELLPIKLIIACTHNFTNNYIIYTKSYKGTYKKSHSKNVSPSNGSLKADYKDILIRYLILMVLPKSVPLGGIQ